MLQYPQPVSTYRGMWVSLWVWSLIGRRGYAAVPSASVHVSRYVGATVGVVTNWRQVGLLVNIGMKSPRRRTRRIYCTRQCPFMQQC